MADAFEPDIDLVAAGNLGEHADQVTDVRDQKVAHVASRQATLVQQRLESRPKVAGLHENADLGKIPCVGLVDPIPQTRRKRTLPDHELRGGLTNGGEAIPRSAGPNAVHQSGGLLRFHMLSNDITYHFLVSFAKACPNLTPLPVKSARSTSAICAIICHGRPLLLLKR